MKTKKCSRCKQFISEELYRFYSTNRTKRKARCAKCEDLGKATSQKKSDTRRKITKFFVGDAVYC